MQKTPSVESYLENALNWRVELHTLREILQATELEETVKWGVPCYTYSEKNVIAMVGFNSYFGLWFYHGSQIDDTANVLINAQEGKTKDLRQWRMDNPNQINTKLIRAYVDQALQIAKRPEGTSKKKLRSIIVPALLRSALDADASLAASFEALTLGRQREYTEYIAEAQQEATKQRRLDKIMPMISNGVGLNDHYR